MGFFTQKLSLLQGSKTTENLIFEYLDQITLAQQHFKLLWDVYLDTTEFDEEFTQSFLKKAQDLHDVESYADKLQRDVELYLYEKTLIPELRADVALLLELLEQIPSFHKTLAYHLQVETPNFPPFTRKYFDDIFGKIEKTVDLLILCVKSFLTDTDRVSEYNKKIHLYESEVNIACYNLRVAIFGSDMPLVEKIHTRFYIDRLDSIANTAEKIADRVSIFVLKRAI